MNEEAKAIIAWFASDEGKRMSDASTLILPKELNQYLANRLHRAFTAGMAAGKKIEREKNESETK